MLNDSFWKYITIYDNGYLNTYKSITKLLFDIIAIEIGLKIVNGELGLDFMRSSTDIFPSNRKKKSSSKVFESKKKT